jgi:hypothetical protein
VLALLSLFVGGISGLVCATFRLVLRRADTLRGELITLTHGEGALGLLLVVAGAAAATAIAAELVRRISPDAEGSGIPQVEAAISGGERGRPIRNAVVKFVGGLSLSDPDLRLGARAPVYTWVIQSLTSSPDPDDLGARPAQRVVGGLSGAAASHQYAPVFTVRLVRPEQMGFSVSAPVIPGLAVGL